MSHWTDQGNCKGSDTEAWFHGNPSEQIMAKKVCANCPVQAECLVSFLFEEHGIFGGKSALQRRKMRRALGLTKWGRNTHEEQQREYLRTVAADIDKGVAPFAALENYRGKKVSDFVARALDAKATA